MEATIKSTKMTNQIIKYDSSDIELLEKHGFLSVETLEDLRNKYAIIEDVETPKGYEENRKRIAVVRDMRVAVESGRKFFKDPVLKLGKLIDSEKAKILDALEEIEGPMIKAKKERDDEKARIKLENEEKERKRKAEIQDKIKTIKAYSEEGYLKASTALQVLIDELKAIQINHDNYQEFLKDAMKAKSETLTQLETYRTQKLEVEEADRKREEEDQRLKDDREKLEQEKADIAEKQKPIMEKFKDLVTKPTIDEHFAKGGVVTGPPQAMLEGCHICRGERIEQSIGTRSDDSAPGVSIDLEKQGVNALFGILSDSTLSNEDIDFFARKIYEAIINGEILGVAIVTNPLIANEISP